MSCNRWTTRFSGKYDDNIHINLYHDGRFGIGPCGLGREILDSYELDLQPVKGLYVDDEIRLSRRIEFSDQPVTVRGTISFDANFTNVTIEIQTLNAGNFETFEGNGTYFINEDN